MPDARFAQLPTWRRPGGREQEPVWAIIEEAVEKAPAGVKTANLDDTDWFYVLAWALQMIIKTRESLPPPDPESVHGQSLAYADHYMHMRADAFNMGPESTTMLKRAVINYDLIKVRGLAFKTGSAPVSPATDVSGFWGLQGIEDGLADRKLHKVTSHTGFQVNDTARFLFQASLLTGHFFLVSAKTLLIDGAIDLLDLYDPDFKRRRNPPPLGHEF